MLMTYYFAAFVTKGVYSGAFIAAWTGFALLSPIMAYFTWMTKKRGISKDYQYWRCAGVILIKRTAV